MITLYFLINCFIAGLHIGLEYQWATTKLEKIKCVGWSTILVFIGIPYFILSLLWLLLLYLYEYLNGHYGLNLWCLYFFTKRFHNMKEEDLIRANHVVETKATSNSIESRSYRKFVSLINKRNNYTYIKPDRFTPWE